MFEGKKVILRGYKESDIEKSWELVEEKGIRELLQSDPIFPNSLENQRDFINKVMKGSEKEYHFAIERKDMKEYIGGCGINSIDRKNSIAEIGIWLGKEYHGKGFASDALRLLCSYLFNELNIHKIKLFYFEFNDAARACYDAVGFKPEGINRQEIYRYGRYSDVITMGMFRNELKL
ncbi:GNAT family protein [uncultured Cetobacterium sp.]|uniref:GNAT family N-acetyltransferase n=1 Tax=uncultured Cetobacterium sp. TaxID=527638 RepID=UPI0026182CC0|nr:GNAT family protein [uncultured Cetobacterium sp.]